MHSVNSTNVGVSLSRLPDTGTLDKDVVLRDISVQVLPGHWVVLVQFEERCQPSIPWVRNLASNIFSWVKHYPLTIGEVYLQLADRGIVLVNLSWEEKAVRGFVATDVPANLVGFDLVKSINIVKPVLYGVVSLHSVLAQILDGLKGKYSSI